MRRRYNPTSCFMSVDEACEELGISKSTFYARVAPELERIAEALGEAPVVRIGRRRLIRRRVLHTFLEALARACGWWFIYPTIMWHLHRVVYLPHFFHINQV